MTTTYYHGTHALRLPSIQQYGLLPGDRVEALGFQRRFPYVDQRPATLYLADRLYGTNRSYSKASGGWEWAPQNCPVAERAVLAVLVSLGLTQPDSNFTSTSPRRNTSTLPRRNHAYEYPGSVPPQCLRLVRLGERVYDPPLPLLDWQPDHAFATLALPVYEQARRHDRAARHEFRYLDHIFRDSEAAQASLLPVLDAATRLASVGI